MSQSVIIQLQEEAMQSDTDISNLIRRAYAIAKKLKLKEFSEWLRYEMNGYEDFEGEEWPDYRIVMGELQGFNPYRGWIPTIIESPSIHDSICRQEIINSISSIKDILQGDFQGAIIPLNSELNKIVSDAFDFNTKYRIYVNKANLLKISDTVKNIVLEWSLNLEEEGIKGEGLVFTESEKNTANDIASIINNFYGDVSKSQVQQNSNDSTQILSVDYSKEDIERIVKNLEENYRNIGLAKEKEPQVEKYISQLEEVIEFELEDNSKIKSILGSIKNILEGVAGNVVASGLIHMIGQIDL